MSNPRSNVRSQNNNDDNDVELQAPLLPKDGKTEIIFNPFRRNSTQAEFASDGLSAAITHTSILIRNNNDSVSTVNNTPTTWRSWLWQKTKEVAITLTKFNTATLLSLSSGIGALVAISGVALKNAKSDPAAFWQDFWNNKLKWGFKWVGSFTLINVTVPKVLSVYALYASLRININLNFNLGPKIRDLGSRIKHAIRDPFNHKAELAKAGVYLTFGATGAIAFSVIAFENYEWLMTIGLGAGTYIIAGATLVSFFIGRALYTNKLIEMVTKHKERSTQKQVIDLLKRATPECKNRLQQILDRDGEDDREHNLCKMFGEYINLLEEHPEYISSPTLCDSIINVGKTIVTIGLGITIAALAGYVFAYKTRVGEGKFAKRILNSETDPIDDLDTFYKVMMGVVGGFANIALYGVAAYEFLGALSRTIKYLKKHPEHTRGFLRDIVDLLFSALSMWYVGQGFPSSNDFYSPNIDKDTQEIIFGLICALGGFMVNSIATLEKYAEKISPNTRNVEDIISSYKNGRVGCSHVAPELEACLQKYNSIILFRKINEHGSLINSDHHHHTPRIKRVTTPALNQT